MSYLSAMMIKDINGNIIELGDTAETLKEILAELKIMNLHLAELTGEQIKREDI